MDKAEVIITKEKGLLLLHSTQTNLACKLWTITTLVGESVLVSCVWNVEVTGLNSGYVEIFVWKGQYKFRQVVTNKQHGNWGRIITNLPGWSMQASGATKNPKTAYGGTKKARQYQK